MKARTTILAYVQRPTSFFGLPPVYVAIVLASSLLPLFAGIGLGAPVMGAAASVGLSFFLAYKWLLRAREDVHFDQIYRATTKYFGYTNRSRTRRFMAGGVK